MMKTSRSMFFVLALCLPALALHAANNGNANSKGRSPGTKTGGFTVVVAGNFKGAGTASIAAQAVTITAQVQPPGGTAGPLTLTNIPLVNDRFTGTGTLLGVPCTVTGRVDVSSATDDEETDQQALTARISATVRDAKGNVVRIIGIQDQASRGGNPGNGGGNGGNGGQ